MNSIKTDSIWQWLSDFKKWLNSIFEKEQIKIHKPVWSAYLYKKVPVNNSKPCFTIENGELIDSVYSDNIKECLEQLINHAGSFDTSFGIILKSKMLVDKTTFYDWTIKSKYGCVVILKHNNSTVAFKHLSGSVKSYLDNDIKVDSTAGANIKLLEDTLYDIEIRYWLLNNDQLEIYISKEGNMIDLDNTNYLKK